MFAASVGRQPDTGSAQSEIDAGAVKSAPEMRPAVLDCHNHAREAGRRAEVADVVAAAPEWSVQIDSQMGQGRIREETQAVAAVNAVVVAEAHPMTEAPMMKFARLWE